MPGNLQEWLLTDAAGNAYTERQAEQTVDIEERELIQKRMRTDRWTLDRGAGYYAAEREKKKLPCLVATGKYAGRSRVRYVGIDFQTFWTHILRRDFYTTAVNAPLTQLIALLVIWYFFMLLGWSSIYYLIWRWNGSCFIGFHGFRSAFMYATETQQTIGYGERATGECWAGAVLVSIHSLQAVLLDSVILGIVFSRISHPKQRSRTILISDCACIARRDGQLKFMFRIADIQKRSVIDPRIRVVMFTWGPGRRTAEGEQIPAVAQDMSVSLERTLLLPVVVEHTIDESSPLFGQTAQSLEAMGAEIVVTLEATSQVGDTFMARQSYLPSEIHWGHTFVNVIRPAKGGDTMHEVDLSRFHDVDPQPGLGDEMAQPHQLSKKVVAGAGAGGVVPGRLLNENTLVLSLDAVVACRNGKPYLMFRLGDTYPGQVVDVQVSAHLYRWNATETVEGEKLPYEEHPLELEPVDLLLRYPVTMLHELDPVRSPIAHWASQRGMRQDADAEVVVVARGTLYPRQEVVTRTRVYSVMGDIKWGYVFLPVVRPSSGTAALGTSSKLGATLDWGQFHAIAPINMPAFPRPDHHSTPPSISPRLSHLGNLPGTPPGVTAAATAAASELGGSGTQQAPPPAAPAMQPPSTAGGSRLARPPIQAQAPVPAVLALHGDLERSDSSGSLTGLGLAQQPGAPGQLTPPAPAVLTAMDASASTTASNGPQPQSQPQPRPRPQPAQLLHRQYSSQQLAQRPLIHRSPSEMLLLPGGGADGPQSRLPGTFAGFAGPGGMPAGGPRRAADDDDTEEASSQGDTASISSSRPLWPQQESGSRFTRTSETPTRQDPRSLKAVLQNIESFLQGEQEQNQLQQVVSGQESGGSGEPVDNGPPTAEEASRAAS